MKSHSLPNLIRLLRRQEAGLTAIELAVVVTILAILAAIVAGSVTGMNLSARGAAQVTDISEVQKSVDRWVGEQPASRYPVSTPVIVDSSNVVASAIPAANGLPQAASSLYTRMVFSDRFTNPEGVSKSFVPDYMARVPKFGGDSPNPWVIDEKGTVKVLQTLATLTPGPITTSTPTATGTPTPSAAARQIVWTNKTSMSTARFGFGLAAGTDGKFYAVAGGVSGSSTTAVEAYDPVVDTWQTLASAPAARYDLGAATGSNGRIYAIGGVSGDYLSLVEEYDPQANSWSARSPMPTARGHLAVVAGSNGKIYALGGHNGQTLTTVEEYDPQTNTWTTRASMLLPRASFAVVASANGKLYALGGECDACATIEEYDPEIDRWTARADMPTPRRYLTGAGASDGRVYAIGGSIGDAVEEYDPATNVWTQATVLPVSRMRARAVFGSNGKLYVIGGELGGGTEVFPTVLEGTIQASPASIPSPTATRTPTATVTPTPTATPTSTPVPSTAFDLSVTSPWPSDIPNISITLSTSVNITSSDGNAKYCPTCPVSPNGYSNEHPAYTLAESNHLVPGLWLHALICRIGTEGAPFNVGFSYSFTAASSGRLYCTINDSKPDDYSGWADNSGSWPVVVRLE